MGRSIPFTFRVADVLVMTIFFFFGGGGGEQSLGIKLHMFDCLNNMTPLYNSRIKVCFRVSFRFAQKAKERQFITCGLEISTLCIFFIKMTGLSLQRFHDGSDNWCSFFNLTLNLCVARHS